MVLYFLELALLFISLNFPCMEYMKKDNISFEKGLDTFNNWIYTVGKGKPLRDFEHLEHLGKRMFWTGDVIDIHPETSGCLINWVFIGENGGHLIGSEVLEWWILKVFLAAYQAERYQLESRSECLSSWSPFQIFPHYFEFSVFSASAIIRTSIHFPLSLMSIFNIFLWLIAIFLKVSFLLNFKIHFSSGDILTSMKNSKIKHLKF